MAIVKAKTLIRGFRGFVEETALVDTGSTYTLIDRSLAEEIDVKVVDKKMKLVVADDHEVVGDLAAVNEIVIEDEALPYAHVVVVEIPKRLAERLEGLGLSRRVIVGLLTLEALGLTPDVVAGKLKKVEALLI